jgi:hypothetical protein
MFDGLTPVGQHISVAIMATPLAITISAWVYQLGKAIADDLRAARDERERR